MPRELLVKEIRNIKLVYLEKNTSVFDAARMMREKRTSSILVLDKNTLAGIVTGRDIVQKVVCGELKPRETTLNQIMSSPVKSIDSQKTLVEAARMMRDTGIKKLAVVEDRQLIGIVTEKDIIEILPALYGPELPHID